MDHHTRLINLVSAAGDNVDKFKWVIEYIDNGRIDSTLSELFDGTDTSCRLQAIKMAFKAYPITCKKFVYHHSTGGMMAACMSNDLKLVKVMWDADPDTDELEGVFKRLVCSEKISVDVIKWLWTILKPKIDVKELVKTIHVCSWDIIEFLVETTHE